MTCLSLIDALGHLWSKKEFQLKGFIFLKEMNLSRQKQNYRFYLFDKSWYFPAKHVICIYIQKHYEYLFNRLRGLVKNN